MFAVALWGYYSFGPYNFDFQSVNSSIATLFRMMLGDLDYTPMSMTHPLLAPVYVTSFGIVIIFIVVNVFIAIIDEWYWYSKQVRHLWPRSGFILNEYTFWIAYTVTTWLTKSESCWWTPTQILNMSDKLLEESVDYDIIRQIRKWRYFNTAFRVRPKTHDNAAPLEQSTIHRFDRRSGSQKTIWALNWKRTRSLSCGSTVQLSVEIILR